MTIRNRNFRNHRIEKSYYFGKMKEQKEPTNFSRLHLLDGLRGLAVINMALFHLCFDLFVLYQKAPDWYERTPVALWQQMICQTFILISGISWNLGKHPWKQGLKLNLLGAGITLVTCWVLPDSAIWFGILTFLGCACILLIPLEGVLKRIPPLAGVLGFLVLFLLTKNLARGYVGIGAFRWELPRLLYACKALTPLGFPWPGFSSGDYFPLFPWFFLYLAGYFSYPLLIRRKRLQKALTLRLPVLSGIGRNSLWIYVLHQPVCLAVCEIWRNFL